MRLPGARHNASVVLFLVLLLMISHVAAQGNLPKLPGAGGDDASKTDDAATNTDAAKTDAAEETATGSATDAKASGSATDKTDSAVPTNLPKASKTEEDAPALTGLPKLKGATYPPPSVPPTSGAPFMYKSSLPEGTVFICVGAALALIGAMIIAWRGFLAWSVHRSVKRAANAQMAKYDGKDPLMGLKKQGPYMNPGPGSTLSLEQIKTKRRASGYKAHTSQTNLFFSPTAGAGMQSQGNRGSGYLPAGYYATGNAAPAGGAGTTHIGGGVPTSNINSGNGRYSEARGHSAGNSRRSSRGPTPPHSPMLPPSRGAESLYNGSRLSTQGLMGQPSNNSLSSLSVGPQGRAPSAYLEELFESHAPPQSPRR